MMLVEINHVHSEDFLNSCSKNQNVRFWFHAQVQNLTQIWERSNILFVRHIFCSEKYGQITPFERMSLAVEFVLSCRQTKCKLGCFSFEQNRLYFFRWKKWICLGGTKGLGSECKATAIGWSFSFQPMKSPVPSPSRPVTSLHIFNDRVSSVHLYFSIKYLKLIY